MPEFKRRVFSKDLEHSKRATGLIDLRVAECLQAVLKQDLRTAARADSQKRELKEIIFRPSHIVVTHRSKKASRALRDAIVDTLGSTSRIWTRENRGLVEFGSLADDWKAVGNDMRHAMAGIYREKEPAK